MPNYFKKCVIMPSLLWQALFNREKHKVQENLDVVRKNIKILDAKVQELMERCQPLHRELLELTTKNVKKISEGNNLRAAIIETELKIIEQQQEKCTAETHKLLKQQLILRQELEESHFSKKFEKVTL